MKLELFPEAEADVIRQFRYYAVDQDAPMIALRFRAAVAETGKRLPANPGVGVAVPSTIQDLRSWPVKGFPIIRVYYLATSGSLRIVRVLHGKRDVPRVLAEDR